MSYIHRRSCCSLVLPAPKLYPSIKTGVSLSAISDEVQHIIDPGEPAKDMYDKLKAEVMRQSSSSSANGAQIKLVYKRFKDTPTMGNISCSITQKMPIPSLTVQNSTIPSLCGYYSVVSTRNELKINRNQKRHTEIQHSHSSRTPFQNMNLHSTSRQGRSIHVPDPTPQSATTALIAIHTPFNITHSTTTHGITSVRHLLQSQGSERIDCSKDGLQYKTLREVTTSGLPDTTSDDVIRWSPCQ